MESTLDSAEKLSVSTRPGPTLVVLTLGIMAMVASAISVVGSDALWLPAMGDRILESRSVPDGIPFAASSSADWVNTTVLGQISLASAHSLGSVGVVVAHSIAVLVTLTVLAVDAN